MSLEGELSTAPTSAKRKLSSCKRADENDFNTPPEPARSLLLAENVNDDVVPAQNLCETCRSINVHTLFPYMKGARPTSVITIRNLDITVEMPPCAFCSLLDGIKRPAQKSSSNECYKLCAHDCCDQYLPSPYMSRTVLSLIDDADSEPGVLGVFDSELEEITYERGCIAVACNTALKEHPYALRARRIARNVVDYVIICYWLHSCDTQHLQTCGSERGHTNTHLRLIDCKKRRVDNGPTDSNLPYAALSYVFGPAQLGSHERLVGWKLPENLPQTIEDAIEVTLKLGMQYLWVDRYCIIQDDEDDKSWQIRRMNLVFANAYVTIIAAAGDGPSHGLPGVSRTPRTSQPYARIGGYCLVSVLPDPQWVIGASNWMKRAWTFQESFLSRRRLIFTSQQLYFECKSSIASETVDYFSAGHPSKMFSGLDLEENEPWAIFKFLGRYSVRYLSFDTDILNAFGGVFHDFRTKEHPVRQYYGIPLMPSVLRENEEGPKHKDISRSEALAAGLCWRNMGIGRRRPQFPSWTWAAWQVTMVWGLEARNGLRIKSETPLLAFLESQDGSVVRVDECGENMLDELSPTQLSSFIRLEGWTRKFSFFFSLSR
jgi:hypothetical protein